MDSSMCCPASDRYKNNFQDNGVSRVIIRHWCSTRGHLWERVSRGSRALQCGEDQHNSSTTAVEKNLTLKLNLTRLEKHSPPKMVLKLKFGIDAIFIFSLIRFHDSDSKCIVFVTSDSKLINYKHNLNDILIILYVWSVVCIEIL